MVQSICVNISGDKYQIIMLYQFLEGLFMLTNVFLFFNAQKIIGEKMIELINQPSNIAPQSLN